MGLPDLYSVRVNSQVASNSEQKPQSLYYCVAMLSRTINVFILALMILVAIQDVRAQSESLVWEEFTAAVQKAGEEEKIVFLFFEAEWCGLCKQMRREVFPQKDVQQKFDEGFIPASIDIESDQKLLYKDKQLSERAFSHQMRIDATPTLMFMNSEGDVIGRYRGFIEKTEILLLLDYIREGHVNDINFAEYKKRRSGE